MIRSTVYTLLLVAIFPLMSGCATYRQAVIEDFRDTFKAEVGIGVGLYADAKVTSFLKPGLGWGGYWKNVGLENRYTDFVHTSLNGYTFPLGVIPVALPNEPLLTSLRMANSRIHVRTGTKNEEISVVGQLFDLSAVSKWDAYGIQKRSSHSVFNIHEATYTEQPFGFEAGVGLLFVNARVGLDPVEFVDLIFTLFGIDILKDNTSGEQGAEGDAKTRAP